MSIRVQAGKENSHQIASQRGLNMRNCYNNVRGAKKANTKAWKKLLPPLGLE